VGKYLIQELKQTVGSYYVFPWEGELIQIISSKLFHPNFFRGVIKEKLQIVICETW